ncbi:MAG: phage tail tube protein [Acidobacteriota bacterium]
MGGTTEAIRTATALPNKETTFGTLMTLASLVDMYVVNSFNAAMITPAYRTDEGKINGTRGKTRRQRETAEGQIDEPLDATSELITHGLAVGYGNDAVTGAADPYTHTIKHPVLCNLAPPSTSFLQGIVCAGLTAGYNSYKGCSLNQLVITSNGQGAIELSRQWKTDGSETAQGAATFPTAFLTLTYLLGSMATFKLYPNGGGAIDVTSQLMSWKITIDFGLTKKKRANSGVFVPGWKYGKGKPAIKVEVVFAADKSDVIYGYFKNDTLLTLQLVLEPGVAPARTIQLDMSQCYVTCKEGGDDSEPTLECSIDELEVIANQGPAIWICKTGVAAYLVGLP